MSRSIFQPEWRTRSRRKRRFYARYMGWLEKTGFVVVGLLVAAFVGSFFYPVDEWISDEDVEIRADGNGELYAEPKLAGKSITHAAVGQRAKLSNLRFQSTGDTLLRANLEGGASGQAISRSLAGNEVKAALESALLNRPIQAREDVPLKVTGIGDIEVEARVRTAPGEGVATPFDPGKDAEIEGEVLEGKHVITAQLGDLPFDVRQAAADALRKKLQGETVEIGGRSQKVEEILDPRFVVRLTAENVASSGTPLQAASLKRTFDAKIQLREVPAELAERIRTTLRDGHQVTAKVQVRTGARPIAYFLLRRS